MKSRRNVCRPGAKQPVEPAASADKTRDGEAPVIIGKDDHPIREQNIDREALKVLYRLRDAGFKGYLVGGGVRDLYLKKRPKDFDISTDARPGQLRKLFRNSRTIGRRFRLVQVFFRGNKIIEVSTLRSRSEYTLDDQEVLPSNNTFGTLQEDAFRRDLTINSLFYEVEGHTIIDYVGGVDDLNCGVIRMVGDPDRRFTRDPVRMMRAIRHASRTQFTVDEDTLAAVRRNLAKLEICPPSRIRDEVLKDLRSGAARPWFDLCLDSGLWTTLFPIYAELLNSTQADMVRQELRAYLGVLDRLHRASSDNPEVRLEDSFLFAVLLLPWACRQYDLPDRQVRGPEYNRLCRTLRDDLSAHFAGRFNLKRMARENMTSLLVNLSTFHLQQKGESWPKWLKKKSYFADCRRFYAVFAEGRGEMTADSSLFTTHHRGRQGDPVKSGASRSSRRRGGVNPAFSSRRRGVFGLRKK
ncbi:MAG: polya polymerase [Desulfobulbus propionicus]|nr:MAG: polya polymerase [Desulfobulbus propionicus]